MGVSLGVDWAGDHWLCLEHRPDSAAPHPETYDSIKDVWEAYDNGHDISRLCIDIPIGVPTGPDERAVDKHCRSHLDRTSTVFRVPVREALEADSPEAANEQSLEMTGIEGTDGVGVQPPAYAIRKQILEVNNFIENCTQDTTDVIYEVHPELCFTALSGSPPQYSKKTAHGAAERIEALETVTDDAAAILGETLTAVKDNIDDAAGIGIDNVLDSLAAMYTATAPENEFWLLTGDSDATPPQRMAYRSPSELD
jgi:predicted RNase H-like nuclease